MLHVWLLIHRLRAEGEHARALQQELYDLFQEDVEVRVRQLTSVSVSAAVTDLEKSFYGTAYALDVVRPLPPYCLPPQVSLSCSARAPKRCINCSC